MSILDCVQTQDSPTGLASLDSDLSQLDIDDWDFWHWMHLRTWWEGLTCFCILRNDKIKAHQGEIEIIRIFFFRGKKGSLVLMLMWSICYSLHRLFSKKTHRTLLLVFVIVYYHCNKRRKLFPTEEWKPAVTIALLMHSDWKMHEVKSLRYALLTHAYILVIHSVLPCKPRSKRFN